MPRRQRRDADLGWLRESLAPGTAHLAPSLGAAKARPKGEPRLGGQRAGDRVGGVEASPAPPPGRGRYRDDRAVQELGRRSRRDRGCRSLGQRQARTELQRRNEVTGDALIRGRRPDRPEPFDRRATARKPVQGRVAPSAELRARAARRAAQRAARRGKYGDQVREHSPDIRRGSRARGARRVETSRPIRADTDLSRHRGHKYRSAARDVSGHASSDHFRVLGPDRDLVSRRPAACR